MFPWSQFITYLFVAAYTPGPNNIISFSNGTCLGWRKGIKYNIGQFFGLIIQMNACLFACRALNELLPWLTPYMRLVGAGYILYLAWKRLRSDTTVEEGESRTGILYGFSMQFLNPKTYFSVFVLAQAYILPYYEDNPVMIVLLCLFMAVNATVAAMCWLFGGSLFRRVLHRHGKAVNIIMALLLAYCAISLFF